MADRATAAMRAADAAGTRNRMGPTFLFTRLGDRLHGQPVDNVTNRHTPVDGVLSARHRLWVLVAPTCPGDDTVCEALVPYAHAT